MKAKLLIVALLLCRFSAFAEPITIEQAKQKAKTFLTQPDGRRKVHAQGESMQLTTVMEDPNLMWEPIMVMSLYREAIVPKPYSVIRIREQLI